MRTSKRFISIALCVLLLLTSLCVPMTAEDVSTGNSYSELRLTGAEGEFLYYDLVFNDAAQLGVTLMGFELDYPDSLTLVSCKKAVTEGMFVTSEALDIKPYTILWVWGTGELPFEEVILARLVFKVSPDVDMDEELNFDLSYQDGNGPSGVDGEEYDENVEITPPPSVDFSDIVEEFPEFRPKSAVILEKVVERGRVIGLELYVAPHNEVDLRSISVDMAYPDGILFGTVNCVYGESGFEREGNTLSWTFAEGASPSGKTKLAELAFKITNEMDVTAAFDIVATVASATDSDSTDIAEDFIVSSYTFDPSAVAKYASVLTYPEKIKKNLADGTYEIFGGSFELVFWNGESSEPISLSECRIKEYIRVEFIRHEFPLEPDPYVYYQVSVEYDGLEFTFETSSPAYAPGDANMDDAVNLTDVSLCLKKIAGWDVSVNSYAADVTCDDVLNLSDTSLMLKYIAGWDVQLG